MGYAYCVIHNPSTMRPELAVEVATGGLTFGAGNVYWA